jgi:hypothetical protein
MATTRLQFFRDIASELGDLIELRQSGSGSSTTVFVSTDDMVFESSALNGRETWYAEASSTSTANEGKRRIVWDTDESEMSITVQPAWPATPQTGDLLLLVNSRSTGVTIPDIHNKIKQLVQRVSAQLAQEAADTPATFDAQSPVIAIPETWRYFLGAQAERGTSGSEDWVNLLGNACFVQKWDRTATIKDQYRGYCQGKRVRLIGAIELITLAGSEMENDDDSVWVPASWLSKLAAAELLEAAAQRTGAVDIAFTFGELVKAQSAQLEGRVKKRWSAIGPRIDLEL